MTTRARTTRPGISAAIVALATVACSNDEGAIPTIPYPPTSAPATDVTADAGTAPTPESKLTSTATDATGSTQPTTSTSTTLAPDDQLAQLRRQVERDFLRSEELISEIAQNPRRVKKLERRLSEALVPGSPRYEELMRHFRGMVTTNQRVVLGDPPIRESTVERIELVGDAPYTEAMVTSCEVDNANVVAVGRSADTILVHEPQDVRAYRAVRRMELTDGVWKQYGGYKVVEYWQEATQCEDS